MTEMLKHAHSGIRWIVLLLLIGTIINALMKWQSNKTYKDGDKKLFLFTMIAMHVQFLLGLVLYFTSPKVIFAAESMKNAMNRFYLVEHSTLMFLAVLFITLGYRKVKSLSVDIQKFKSGFIYYLVGLILLLAGIPWPFRIPGAGWF